MKLSIIMVMTADGVIAKSTDHNAFEWTSKEDKKHFVVKSKEIGVVMMGGTTFKASGRKSYKDRLAIILTSNPDKYDYGDDVTTKGGDPKDIYKELEEMNLEKVALIGGAKTNAAFLQAGLVDDIYLTVEPLMFGEGLHIADGIDLNLDLTLNSVEQLNDKGTLLLHYEINKN